MICINDHKQIELFDPWRFLSPRRRQLLDQSWAGLFKDEILCELPVSEFVPFFADGFGRPTKGERKKPGEIEGQDCLAYA